MKFSFLAPIFSSVCTGRASIQLPQAQLPQGCGTPDSRPQKQEGYALLRMGSYENIQDRSFKWMEEFLQNFVGVFGSIAICQNHF